jgi:hypothetical protein
MKKMKINTQPKNTFYEYQEKDISIRKAGLRCKKLKYIIFKTK